MWKLLTDLLSGETIKAAGSEWGLDQRCYRNLGRSNCESNPGSKLMLARTINQPFIRVLYHWQGSWSTTMAVFIKAWLYPEAQQGWCFLKGLFWFVLPHPVWEQSLATGCYVTLNIRVVPQQMDHPHHRLEKKTLKWSEVTFVWESFYEYLTRFLLCIFIVILLLLYYNINE